MKKILIADDAIFMRTMLKKILQKGNYLVIGEASNGAEAAEKVKSLHPDIVTMDITMPEVNGIEGIKRIREFDKDVKIIMVSAMGQQHLVVEAIQSGASDFIVKPFTEERVLSCLEKVSSI